MDKKILIIDDEPGVCSVVSQFLEKKGFTSISANSGKEGIEIADHFKPDLILLDINMPEMDGFAVLVKLKNNQRTMSIPIVMLTGRSDEIGKISASALSCEYYITKPFDLEELDSKIKQILKITP